eukprot:1776366-Alexandrium_andersonii.AAC.1
MRSARPNTASTPPRHGYSNRCRAVNFLNMWNCLRRSKLELRGPRNGLKVDPKSSGAVQSAP